MHLLKVIYLKIFLICLLWECSSYAQSFQSANGPEGGTVHTLLLKDRYLFAGMRGGVFRLDLNGGMWTLMNNGLVTDWTVTCMAKLGQTIVAGSEYKGIYVTTDNGESWELSNTGTGQNAIKALTTDSSCFYALTNENYIYSSSNSGKTWTQIPSVGSTPGVSSADPAAMAVIGNYAIIAGAYPDYGVFRSKLDGTSQSKESTLSGVRCNKLLSNGPYVYAGSDRIMYRSSDSGKTWQQFSSGLPSTTLLDTRFISSVNNHLFTSDFYGDIYCSDNNGISWGKVSKNLPKGFWPLCFTGDGDRLYVGSQDDGVLTSSDSGATWSSLNSGLHSRRIFDVAVNGNYLFANSEFGRLYIKDLVNQSWSQVDPAQFNNEKVRCLVTHQTSVFAGTWGAGVFRSDDNGRTWVSVNSYLTDKYIVSLSSCESKIFAGSTDNVFVSSNNGDRWIKSLSGISTNDYVRGVCESGPFLFAATSDKVYRSKDNGANWDTMSNGIQTNAIWCIASIGTKVFVGTWGGVFATQDSGATWKRSDFGVPYNEAYSLISYQGLLYLGTNNGGVFVSSDSGNFWNPVGSEIPPLITNSIEALAVGGGNLYAATVLRSVQQYSLGNSNAKSPVARSKASNVFSVAVDQFSNSVDFRYVLSTPGSIKFQITDLSGRLKSETTQRIVTAGNYTFTQNINHLPSGLYCARMLSGSKVHCCTFLVQR